MIAIWIYNPQEFQTATPPPVSIDESAQKVTKTDAMENKAMAEIITLAQRLGDGLVLLSEVMEYRVTEECLPIFNINGTLMKG